jgi:hypothetical protein
MNWSVNKVSCCGGKLMLGGGEGRQLLIGSRKNNFILFVNGNSEMLNYTQSKNSGATEYSFPDETRENSGPSVFIQNKHSHSKSQ